MYKNGKMKTKDKINELEKRITQLEMYNDIYLEIEITEIANSIIKEYFYNNVEQMSIELKKEIRKKLKEKYNI